MMFVFDRDENIVGKEENAGYQHFLLFPQCFQKAFNSGSLKVGIAWERVQESNGSNQIKKETQVKLVWIENTVMKFRNKVLLRKFLTTRTANRRAVRLHYRDVFRPETNVTMTSEKQSLSLALRDS